MPHEFSTTRLIEFADTDMAGIVHFANYFRFMESTEHEFFRSLGLSVHQEDAAGVRGWVRVHAECDYQRPLRYQERVRIRLSVVAKGEKSITYGFEFLVDETTGRAAVAATGRVVVVYVRKDRGSEVLMSAPMPNDVNRALQEAPTSSRS